MPTIVTPLTGAERAVEVVERKGVGHPDTICDALAEQLSRDLSAAYRSQFGTILPHNLDKALLVGGSAVVEFGGGYIKDPIDIYLGGRATGQVGETIVPIWDIAQVSVRRWLRENLHALDADTHVRVRPLIQLRSQRALQPLRLPGLADDTPRANDTAFGVGYAPLSALEQLVLEVDQRVIGEIRAGRRLAWGEDVKIVATRIGRDVRLTIACAMIGAGLADIDDYLAETAALRALVREAAEPFGFASCTVSVNATDDPHAGVLHLTVTGTSAESGDAGQVGRGNRINGLITPVRPMTLEAAAGKNPARHVGRLYNQAAQTIAQRVVAAFPEVVRAECVLVSRIGSPLTEPAVAEIGIQARDSARQPALGQEIAAIVDDALAELVQRVPAV